jgi:hypothetical protein
MKMTIANELIKAVTASSKGSSRSLQKQVGPSEIGGCRRKTWLKINGYQSTNPNTLRLSAIMGTAIHTYIQEAFERQDPFKERYILEGEFEYEGLMGHVDMYDKENCEVVDWKTVKKTNLTYFPSKQQRMQVQLYGYLLTKNGTEVKTVTLVAIPRDGDERDIVYHSEPYDESVALAGLAWLKEVQEMTEAPAPEKDAFFCQHYCNFYDKTGMVGCTGKGKAEAEGALIEDEEARSAARDYLQVISEINELEKAKDSLKVMLEGISGVTPEGIKVVWSSVAGRKSVDEDKVRELLGEVPVKYGKESYRLSVKGE